MKQPRQFLPLLKHILGLYRYGPIPLLLWFLSAGAILYFVTDSIPTTWAQGIAPRDFALEQMACCMMFWLFLMFASTPLLHQLLGGMPSFEFLFTRAIDRAVWVRAEGAAVIVFSATPLAVNLVCRLFKPAGDLPQGAAMFAAWLLWLALVLIFLALAISPLPSPPGSGRVGIIPNQSGGRCSARS